MGTTDNSAVQAAMQTLQSSSSARSSAKPAAASGLSGSVDMGAANAPDDVMKVSSALAANGLMEAAQSHARDPEQARELFDSRLHELRRIVGKVVDGRF